MSDFDLTLDVPDNIREMSQKQLVEWAGDRIKPTGSFNQTQVMNILNNIFMKMGLKLDNEQLLFLLDDSDRLLCEASAGSGKTTVSQLKMVKYKLLYGIDGSDILTIAYNDHAVEDMEKRHRVLVENINAQGISGVKLSDRIVCRTFHSNALAWVTEYAKRCGIENKETIIISDTNEEKFMTKALESAIKKFLNEIGEDESKLSALITPTMVPALINFNSYMEEKMLAVEDWQDCPQFKEIGLKLDIVQTAIARFNKTCEFNSMYTFSRVLVKFYELLRDNEDVRTRVQNAYRVLLVDEYQDMSPLMNEIIALMLNDHVVFNAIGDGDQAIYAFKGTDSLNCLKFRNYFPNGKVVSMGANRRCRKAIVDVARNILSINQLRYPKKIYSINDGGNVTTVGYDTQTEEIAYIISELKKIPTDELYDVCIAYRNKESSALLTKMMLDARIPFKVNSGYTPYKDVLSSSLYEIFAMLKNPMLQAYHERVLYKVTPANRSQIAKVINSAGHDEGLRHYLDYDWDLLGGNLARSVKDKLSVLKECEDALKAGAPMVNYFGKIYNMFKLYYWNWYSEQHKFSKELEDSIVSDYATERSYAEFNKMYLEQANIRDKFARTGVGCTLTTFHGLKGLEFSKVFLIDLDNDIFPNYSKIEKECGGNLEAELEEKEECVRLFYVACTRPKDSLVAMYSKNNPSIYVDLLTNAKATADDNGSKKKSEEDGELNDLFLDLDGLFNTEDEEDMLQQTESEPSQGIAVGDDAEDGIVIKDDDGDSNLLSDFEVPSDAVVVSEESDDIPIADHDMFMVHEPSGSYYKIDKGEKCYTGSSIDFENSHEVSEEEYLAGKRQEEEDEKLFQESMKYSAKKSQDNPNQGGNRLEKTLGILDMFGE